MGKDDKLYSETDLESAMQRVLEAQSSTILKTLEEKGLLKEEKEPGKLKKVLAGIVTLATDRIDKLEARGSEALIKSAIEEQKEKAKKRAIEEVEKQFAGK